MMRLWFVPLALTAACYHYSFEQRRPRPFEAQVVHAERAGTWLNGFVGTGKIDTSQYCSDPIRTELRVNATDVLISIATLLVYTPHTLYVTCGVQTRPDVDPQIEVRGAP